MKTVLPGLVKLLKHSIFLFFLLIQTSLFGQQQENPAGPLVEYTETYYSPLAKGLVANKHRFKYNEAGKIAVDLFSYSVNGKVMSVTKYDYHYDAAGRLSGRFSSHNQNKFFYNAEGLLVKYEGHFLVNKSWELLEEGSVTEKPAGAGKGKSLQVVVRKKSSGASPATLHTEMEYFLDQAGNIGRVQLSRYANKPLNASYTFTYDGHPNPLQQAFIDRKFDQLLETGSLQNILARASGTARQAVSYEYNAAGYPLVARVGNSKLKEFRYQNDPVRPPSDLLASLSAIDTTTASTSAAQQATCRLTDFTESFQHPVLKSLAQYKHHFEYDKAGRPIRHTKTYYERERKVSLTTFQYQYNPAGKLVSKTSETQQQKYFYDEKGEISKVEVYLKSKEKGWELNIRSAFNTQLKPDQGKEIKQVYQARGRSTQADFHNEYLVDAAGLVQQSRSRYLQSKVPAHHQVAPSTYTYDGKPNPLRHLYINTLPNSYQKESTPHNTTQVKSGSRVFSTIHYEYNQYGYPVKAVSESPMTKDKAKTRRVEEFAYEVIPSAPAVPEPDKLLAGQIVDLRLAPNPARTSFQLSVNNPGPGTVEIRILDIAGTRIFKNVTLPATDKLQTTIQVGDLPRGLYVVEVTAPKGVFARRLVLE
ncbi:MAG: T9SS type A sorting domain-containing protein [Adhaeribacter sp.]